MKSINYVLILLLVTVAACAAPTTTENHNDVPDALGDDTIPEDDGMNDNDAGHNDGMTEGSMDSEIEETSEADVTFRLTGENFAFFKDGVEAPELVVQEGDLVRIEFESTQGMHDWVVDEFDARTEVVTTSDGVTVVEFVADQTGTFEYYCSVGSHRANGMIGNLVVQ